MADAPHTDEDGDISDDEEEEVSDKNTNISLQRLRGYKQFLSYPLQRPDPVPPRTQQHATASYAATTTASYAAVKLN